MARVRRCSSEWLWCDNFEQVNSPRTTWLLNSTDALVSCWGLDSPLIHVSAGPTTCLFAGPTSSQLEETSARARPPAAAHSSPFPNLSLLQQPSANVYLLRHTQNGDSMDQCCSQGALTAHAQTLLNGWSLRGMTMAILGGNL